MLEREHGQSKGLEKVEESPLFSMGELLEIGFFSGVLGMLVVPKICREVKKLVVKGNVGGKNPRVNPKRRV